MTMMIIAAVLLWVLKVVGTLIFMLAALAYFGGHDDESRYGATDHWLRTRNDKGDRK